MGALMQVERDLVDPTRTVGSLEGFMILRFHYKYSTLGRDVHGFTTYPWTFWSTFACLSFEGFMTCPTKSCSLLAKYQRSTLLFKEKTVPFTRHQALCRYQFAASPAKVAEKLWVTGVAPVSSDRKTGLIILPWSKSPPKWWVEGKQLYF